MAGSGSHTDHHDAWREANFVDLPMPGMQIRASQLTGLPTAVTAIEEENANLLILEYLICYIITCLIDVSTTTERKKARRELSLHSRL